MLMEMLPEQLDETAIRYFQTIHTNTMRMDDLITELLALSRVNRTRINTETIAMTKLVQQVVDECLPERRTIDITIEDMPDIKGDKILLTQVWHNLVENAIKFTSRNPAPRIVIRGARKNGNVVYSIQDNGVGFDPAYAKKLFGVFQRLHGQDEFEGTGIGLAIVARIVRRHGGEAWAEGIEHQGATFYFSIPTQ
jgi:light-regulated signal transduction histidine kinase (bacteriophytochrome)